VTGRRAPQLAGVADVISRVGLNAAGLATVEFDALRRAEMPRNEKLSREAGLKFD
jgi:hypothetical protein